MNYADGSTQIIDPKDNPLSSLGFAPLQVLVEPNKRLYYVSYTVVMRPQWVGELEYYNLQGSSVVAKVTNPDSTVETDTNFDNSIENLVSDEWVIICEGEVHEY